MNNREMQLKQLGFERNEHQFCFHHYKYGSVWTVDFWDITELTDEEWEEDIKFLKNALKLTKKRYFEDLKLSEGYKLCEKEIKQKLLDKLNHLRSDYQQQTQSKLGRTSNFKYETELQAQITLLKKLMK